MKHATVEHAPAPRETEPYAARARFYSVEEGFNIARPALRPRAFTAERDQAFGPDGPTGIIPLDCSELLGLPFPATSPLMLASYIRLRANEQLETHPQASGEVYVVLRGNGSTEKGGDCIGWEEGDIFCLPGGEAPTWHRAERDAVLYAVSDEPALRFGGVGAPRVGEAAIEAVLYPKDMIRRTLDELRTRQLPPDAPGRAVNLSSAVMARQKTCLPFLTLTFNVIPPGDRQRPHRHNAAALVLVLEQGHCLSQIGHTRLPWSDHAVILTPAGDVHMHENAAAGAWATALIVQDGGLHYHCRTMGFAFA